MKESLTEGIPIFSISGSYTARSKRSLDSGPLVNSRDAPLNADHAITAAGSVTTGTKIRISDRRFELTKGEASKHERRPILLLQSLAEYAFHMGPMYIYVLFTCFLFLEFVLQGVFKVLTFSEIIRKHA